MTSQIVISDISIHKDAHGRYSLNDLHKASGKEDKHQPAFFMRRNETIEMIEVISNSAKSQSYKPVISKSGRYGGTYVCKELVYSYAMWISAAFALKVIRAYDALVSSVMPKQASIQFSTAKELIPLRQTAERLIAHGVGNIYPDIWKHVHAEFGVQHINELLPEQIPLAISYLDALEGEYIPKQEEINISEMNVRALYSHMKYIVSLCKEQVSPSLIMLGAKVETPLRERIETAACLAFALHNDVERKTK